MDTRQSIRTTLWREAYLAAITYGLESSACLTRADDAVAAFDDRFPGPSCEDKKAIGFHGGSNHG